MDDAIEYPLQGDLQYKRRPTMSTLLFSIAKHVAKIEKKGGTGEFAHASFTGDGDYVGTFLLDHGDEQVTNDCE